MWYWFAFQCSPRMNNNVRQGWKNHAKLWRKSSIFVLIHNVQALRYQMMWPSWSRKALPEIINKLIYTPWLIKEFYGVTNLKIFFHISHSNVIITVWRVIQEMMEIFAQKQLLVAENTFNHIGVIIMCYRLGLARLELKQNFRRASCILGMWFLTKTGHREADADRWWRPDATRHGSFETNNSYHRIPPPSKLLPSEETHHNMWANVPK